VGGYAFGRHRRPLILKSQFGNAQPPTPAAATGVAVGTTLRALGFGVPTVGPNRKAWLYLGADRYSRDPYLGFGLIGVPNRIARTLGNRARQ
jgi:hypothetical protein